MLGRCYNQKWANGEHQTHAMAETVTSAVFNKKTVVLASVLGNAGAKIM